MTAVTTFAEYKTLAREPRLLLGVNEANAAIGVIGRLFSSWLLAGGDTGIAPTTAVVPTKDTVGAIPGFCNSAAEQFIARWYGAMQNKNGILVADRLSHQAGLSGTVTTEQTTNLPTAALTRYTSGAGVMIGLEIYTQIGVTSTTVTARYTNQAGTGSRTTTAVLFGSTANRDVSRVIVLPLQDGDTGVQSVEGVTVLATTGTAGNFGVTLFRPLFPLGYADINIAYRYDGFLNNAGMLPKVENNACLFELSICNSASASGSFAGTLSIIEP